MCLEVNYLPLEFFEQSDSSGLTFDTVGLPGRPRAAYVAATERLNDTVRDMGGELKLPSLDLWTGHGLAKNFHGDEVTLGDHVLRLIPPPSEFDKGTAMLVGDELLLVKGFAGNNAHVWRPLVADPNEISGDEKKVIADTLQLTWNPPKVEGHAVKIIAASFIGDTKDVKPRLTDRLNRFDRDDGNWFLPSGRMLQLRRSAKHIIPAFIPRDPSRGLNRRERADLEHDLLETFR